jgi:NADPH2:quinone reductase
MKEAIVAKGPKVTIHDVPIPKPGAGQILIKVIYSGSNPKDWKLPEAFPPHNSGDDIAGIVEEVGDGVVEFLKGDRVAAFHEMGVCIHNYTFKTPIHLCLCRRKFLGHSLTPKNL